MLAEKGANPKGQEVHARRNRMPVRGLARLHERHGPYRNAGERPVRSDAVVNDVEGVARIRDQNQKREPGHEQAA